MDEHYEKLLELINNDENTKDFLLEKVKNMSIRTTQQMIAAAQSTEAHNCKTDKKGYEHMLELFEATVINWTDDNLKLRERILTIIHENKESQAFKNDIATFVSSTGHGKTPYAYQQACVESALELIKNGISSLYKLTTGAGKSIIISLLCWAVLRYQVKAKIIVVSPNQWLNIQLYTLWKHSVSVCE